jgi:hypothetical protein
MAAHPHPVLQCLPPTNIATQQKLPSSIVIWRAKIERYRRQSRKSKCAGRCWRQIDDSTTHKTTPKRATIIDYH